MKIGSSITRPEIFFLFAAIYILLGVFAVLDPAMLAINPNLAISPLAILVWLFGFFCLFLGFRLSDRVFSLGPVPLIVVFILGCITVNYLLGVGWIPSIILNSLALLGCYIVLNLRHLTSKGFLRPFLRRLSPKLTKRVYWEYLFLAGLVIFLANMLLVGIPLLNPPLHNDLLTVLNLPFVFGFYLMLYSTVRFFTESQGETPFSSKFLLIPPSYKRKNKRNMARTFLLILLILAIFSTFRSYIVIVFFTWLFLELGRNGSVKPRKILPIILVFLVALVPAVLIGHSLMSIGESEWGTDPIGTTEYRIGFTNHVFDDVVKKSFPWGYSFGESLEKPFGLYTCYILYGCEGRMTSALLGEPMMDFGLPAVILVMLFTGAVLQRLYKRDYALYAFFLSLMIIALEISAGYFFILIFAYLGYLAGWKAKSSNS